MVCQGTEAIAFSPTLTFTPQTTTVTIKDVLAPCVVAGDPTTTSATVSTAVSRPNFSCLSLFGGGAATRTFHWNDGTSSTFTHISNVQIVGGNFVVTLQGTITSGCFAGSTATGVVALTANLVQCLPPTGLGSATGTFTFTIV